MATLKTRINISLSKEVDHALAALAKRDRIPRATKAVELLNLALELEEDSAWDALARQRDTRGARFLSHKEVWK
ncbi:MAG: hypothetical protein A3D52_01985 [Candidatus Taylorbacteria bacterium RIFCSPHIGHO2_02_FULL_44_36]|uniref:Antitoxin, RHH family protein n=1 Tax=Candidatus Taylorbacteria bacterium RIFCSPLOWO2_12_FULL_44_15c TaxID=1802333 RepID=A0A1G2P6L3_9BACT|nr:MAG: hypothetical protein A3D52_01985 [Candidatus Taylorbacteria bacterium RIFCSPHIGHO2_02_FULL_44_36]OHA37941.1 MAG: hypothetical protein A3I97_02760 [Candidatus Taylorbacteria bacterium RIFCSPLOWO2_02_FULL_44_35]OHA43359.1 MAG: hypothetical protein A3G03_03270 [Candidatus Taylorbacteria bacterium RIFCSPLOWO2_12_FULL_44_15c]